MTALSRRVTALSVGELIIRDARESDEGKYECVAENRVGIAYSYGANLYVRGTYFYEVGVTYSYGANLYVRGTYMYF